MSGFNLIARKGGRGGFWWSIYIQVDANTAAAFIVSYLNCSEQGLQIPIFTARTLFAHNGPQSRARSTHKREKRAAALTGGHSLYVCRMGLVCIFAPWARTHKVWGLTLLLIAFHSLHPFKVHLPSAAERKAAAEDCCANGVRQTHIMIITFCCVPSDVCRLFLLLSTCSCL